MVLPKFGINEIFYSIQGEGAFSGWPALFIRFAGCNLKCPWCDTDSSLKETLTIDEMGDWIAEELVGMDTRNIIFVLTGGEPTMQDYLNLLRLLDKTWPCTKITMETNGRDSARMEHNRLRGTGVLWTTVSPKIGIDDCEPYFQNRMWQGDEMKVVMDPKWNGFDKDYLSALPFRLEGRFKHFWIQPCSEDYEPAVQFVKENPQWKLSIQTQKVVGVE